MKEMNQKMGTHTFRFSDIMPHSWLYKLKRISRSNRKRLPSSPKHLSSTDVSSSRKIHHTLRLSSSAHHPQGSSSRPKFLFKRKIKRKTVYKPSSRLKLSFSSLTSHVPLTTYRNHRSISTSAHAIILDPPLNSHVSPTSSLNHRSKSSSAHAIFDSTAESSSVPVSSSHYDQTYGIKAFLGVVSEDPSISDNSRPVLVETVKQPPIDTRTQQKLKKPKAVSSGIKIRMKLTIARKKTKESKKKKIAESFAIVLTSVDPERDFRESMVEMIVENKMKEQTDLEDLLVCYLSLNSSEYHDIIIKAFEKTWSHLRTLFL